MKEELKKYLAEIGAKGGKTSRRKITPEQQAAMQEARKAKRRSQGANDVLLVLMVKTFVSCFRSLRKLRIRALRPRREKSNKRCGFDPRTGLLAK